MTTRNVIDVVVIALLAAFITIMSARAQNEVRVRVTCFATLCTAEEVPRGQQSQLIKPTWNNGPPEPYFKPKPLTPQYIEWLRKINQLPPEEFDHEYKSGELKVLRCTQAQLREWCPGAFNTGWNALGCAKSFFGGAICVVYILNDQGLQAINYDFEIVLRHERAHCNGWVHPRAK